MNASFYAAQVIGYVGHVRQRAASGGSVYAVSVCITVPPTDDSEAQTHEWVEGILSGALASAVGPHLSPGRLIYLDGPLTHKRYVKKDGTPGVADRIKVCNFRFLD